MAGSHARDLEWHVGENSRKKAMCVTAAWVGGYEPISTVYLGALQKRQQKHQEELP